jgi:hypothetical protein
VVTQGLPVLPGAAQDSIAGLYEAVREGGQQALCLALSTMGLPGLRTCAGSRAGVLCSGGLANQAPARVETVQ